MGMGLAIVRSIVEAHGGTIVGENAPDRGARMIVRLPAVRGQRQTKPLHERSEQSGRARGLPRG